MANAIILAAGKGTRMKSEQAKCLQPVLFKPILRRIVDGLKAAGIKRIVIIIGYKGEDIQAYFKDEVEYAWQNERKGTAHAVMQAEFLKDYDEKTIVINGDVPLVKVETFKNLLTSKDSCDMELLSTIMEDPQRYGRIVRDKDNNFVKVVETDDCNNQEIKINEINGAIYCFDNKKLWECLPDIEKNNNQGEYYLTDVVELFVKKGYKVKATIVDDALEIMGVDHRQGQLTATKKIQKEINNRHLENGVALMCCDTIYIEDEVEIASDVTIFANVQIKGKTIIKTGAVIESGSVIIDSIIEENARIESSKITESTIGQDTTVGPYAHIKAKSVIGKKCRIGNFVEIKKTKFGDGSKCAHLTYLGDCEVGENVNIGCGVVAVNYDGKAKHLTIIEDGAFIGSNVNLIAPIKIGKNALVAAGSTIDKDVPSEAMSIARAEQCNKEGYSLKYRNK